MAASALTVGLNHMRFAHWSLLVLRLSVVRPLAARVSVFAILSFEECRSPTRLNIATAQVRGWPAALHVGLRTKLCCCHFGFRLLKTVTVKNVN